MKALIHLTLIFSLSLGAINPGYSLELNSKIISADSQSLNSTKKVLMIINEGFWAPEYYKPREIFDKQGYKITVAGKYPGMVYPDKRNTTYKPVKVDLTYNDINLADYDAVTFAGGNGAWTDYFPDDRIHKIVTEAIKKNMPIGLLCASTGLLGMTNNYDGKAPVAKGRHVTGYYRVEGIMRNLGQVNFDSGIKGKPFVVRDNNLLTGRDPESSELFGNEFVKLLSSN